jgi:hypothetical protein
MRLAMLPLLKPSDLRRTIHTVNGLGWVDAYGECDARSPRVPHDGNLDWGSVSDCGMLDRAHVSGLCT